MTWGALLQGVAKGAAKGAVQGSVKKVTAKKFLGRGGKKDRRQNVKNIMQEQGEYEGGGALAIRPTTSLVPTQVSDSSLAVSSGPSGQGLGGTLLRIHTKTIAIDKFLKTQKKNEKVQDKKQKKADEDIKRGKREGALEKPKDKKKKKKQGLSLPMPSFFSEIKKFITNILLGWITMKLLDLGPKLMPVLKLVGKALEGFLTIGGFLFDAVATVISIGYDAFTGVETVVKNVFGDKGLEIFHKFTDAFKVFLTTGIIAALFAAKAGVLGQVAAAAQWATTVAGPALASGLKTVATGATKVAGAIFSVPTAIVSGAGLLASAIGEGGYHLVEWSKNNLEGPAQEAWKKSESKPWYNVTKYWDLAVYGVLSIVNTLSGFFFNLLDIIGTPFRYLIEALRWPFLNEADRKTQGDNLAKFDARLREGFRGFFNKVDFLNVISDNEGDWGSLWGDRGTEGMGYTEGNSGDKGESNEGARLGKIIQRDMTLDVHAGEMVIDATGTSSLRPMLMAINNANSSEEAIEAVRSYASYEFGSSQPPLAIPIPLNNDIVTPAGEKMVPIPSFSANVGGDFTESLYKGG